MGASIVSLEPVSVQDFTLTAFLHECRHFRPPWLWSVLQVVREIHTLGLVRIGGFEFFPVPKLFAHNCDRCDARLVAAIKRYNATSDISALNVQNCEHCSPRWVADMADQPAPLAERILELLEKIDRKEILARMASGFEFRGRGGPQFQRLPFRSCGSLYM